MAQKITSPSKVNVKLDFPGEGRKGKKGKGWSANLEFLEKPVKKVALVSFFVFDPGYTSSFKVNGVSVILPKNRTIGLVKNETIKLTKTNETNTTKIHC